MTQDRGELVVRDLGSTNGIRINGQRVEMGRLRPGDELSIAHIRYRLDSGAGQEKTQAEPFPSTPASIPSPNPAPTPLDSSSSEENPLAAAVRDLLPSGVADRCRIQVIVQMRNDGDRRATNGASAAEDIDACRHSSSP
jgi:hypothetical protein